MALRTRKAPPKRPKDRKPFESAASSDPTAPLSAMQAAFVREYLIDLKGGEAMVRAGYSAASTTSLKLLMNRPNVAAAIKAEMDARAQRTHITQDRVMLELGRIAFGDVRKLFKAGGELKAAHEIDDETAGALAGIDITTVSKGEGAVEHVAKVRMTDKIRALELCGKHLGMFKDQVEHVGAVKFVIER